MDKNEILALEKVCKEIRKEIARCGYESGKGHVSSSMSLVEIFASLYFGNHIDIGRIKNNCGERDRLILSKGHAGLVLYTTLAKAGILEENMLDGFATREGRLYPHPISGAANGIEMSAGSLGQGLGFACGTALAGKMSGKEYHTYVIVGDGELQEGSNWESMLFAAQMKLNNLTLIVDQNGLQITGPVDDIISVSPLKEKLDAFGFFTIEIDGHDLNQINNALSEEHGEKPKAIIAHTIKGKGISFMENQNGWHGKGLTYSQYQQFIKEAGV